MTNASRDGRNAAVKQVGRSAAITGAGSGLGRDIALGLAEKGYAVFGTAMTAAEVQAADGRVSLSLCDIAKEQDVKAWAGRVSAALGDGRGLDLLISNAGILELLGRWRYCRWTPSVANSTSTYLAHCPL